MLPGCKKDPPKQGFVVVYIQPTRAPDISYVSVRSPGVEVIRRTEADDPITEERIQVFDREAHLAIPTRGGVLPQVLTVLQIPIPEDKDEVFLSQIRFLVAESLVGLRGEPTPVKVPSGSETGLKLVPEDGLPPFRIRANAVTRILVEIDLNQQFIENPNYIFKPIIRGRESDTGILHPPLDPKHLIITTGHVLSWGDIDILNANLGSGAALVRRGITGRSFTVRIPSDVTMADALTYYRTNSSVVSALQPGGYVANQTRFPNDFDMHQYNLHNPGPTANFNPDAVKDIDINAPEAWDLFPPGVPIDAIDVTIGVLDTGIQLDHPDIEDNIYVNEDEIPSRFRTGTSRFGEIRGGIQLGVDVLDHAPEAGCGNFAGGPTLPPNGRLDPLDLIGPTTVLTPFEGDLDGDGCPGVCGNDDDADGAADYDDPEVANADYSGGGCTVADCLDDPNCPDAISCTREMELASYDDDENGLADDIIGWDFGDHDNCPFDAGSGHGTAVAAIIGAIGDNATGLPGVLWRTRLLPLKASLDTTRTAMVTAASFDAFEYAWRMNVDIVNMSNSVVYTGNSAANNAAAWMTSFEAHHGTDSLIVAGTPNEDRDLDSADIYALPAEGGYPNVVVATSISLNGNPTPFTAYSSSRTSVDIAGPTPAYTLYNTVMPDNHSLVNAGQVGKDFLGSSAVAPQISGTIGLMLSIQPALQNESPIDIIHLLLRSGANLSSKLSNGVSCGCRLDAFQAVTTATAFQP